MHSLPTPQPPRRSLPPCTACRPADAPAWLGSVPGERNRQLPGARAPACALRRGFTDPRTRSDCSPGSTAAAEDAVVAALGETADPDLALSGLSRLLASAGPADRAALLDALADDERLRRRLLGVLG